GHASADSSIRSVCSLFSFRLVVRGSILVERDAKYAAHVAQCGRPLRSGCLGRREMSDLPRMDRRQTGNVHRATLNRTRDRCATFAEGARMTTEPSERGTLRTILLACGILSSLLYVAHELLRR